jgi:hypothetical protein
MKLSKSLSIVPIFTFMTMAALADDAAMPPPAGPAAACKQDVQTLCPGIQPGGGRIVTCLKSHAEQVSLDCKAAIKAARGHHAHQPTAIEPSAEGPTSN